METSSEISSYKKESQELAEKAFNGLFPEKNFNYIVSISYSGKFSDYNANVKFSKTWMQFKLSKKWVLVSEEIKIGLLQSLMLKIFKVKKSTLNTDLYNKFLKNAHISAEKTKKDEVLESSFRRINEKFFNGMMDMTNLEWNKSSNVLGRYEYGSDTIMISKILEDDYELMDYVMHHEMLHKKFKFKEKNGRTLHHSSEFRKEEKAYPDSEMLEARLKRVISTHKSLSKPASFPKRKRRFSLKFW